MGRFSRAGFLMTGYLVGVGCWCQRRRRRCRARKGRSIVRVALMRMTGRWVALVGAVAAVLVITSLLVVPRVAGQQGQTIVIDVAFDQPNIHRLAEAPDGAWPARGEVSSGGGKIFDGDLEATEQIGEFYFIGVGTSAPEYFETAANHLFEVARFELWGQGSIDVMGTVTFRGTSHLSITGGTGAFAMARGECTEEMVASRRGRFTCYIER